MYSQRGGNVKMKKKIKKGSALALALVLTLSTVVLSKVQAAISIETNRQCSVKFELDAVYPELSGENMTIPVHLYKVADVNQYGEYQTLAGFEDLKLDSISSKTTAQEWEVKAKSAVKTIEENKIEATASGSLTGGRGSVDGLSVGMYLVEAEKVQSPYYTYRFTPYLISLPNNQYYVTGSDDWIYDASTGLKPDQQARFGDLEIDKTLTSYNETMKGASFVFDIEAQVNGEVVYSDVVSMVFDGTGTKKVVVKDLPAGADVTVTEVYSGSSYEVTGDAEQTTQIAADEMVSVAFENRYDGTLNGGSSVVNHFEFTPQENTEDDQNQSAKNGVWDWKQQTDSTQAQE